MEGLLLRCCAKVCNCPIFPVLGHRHLVAKYVCLTSPEAPGLY